MGGTLQVATMGATQPSAVEPVLSPTGKGQTFNSDVKLVVYSQRKDHTEPYKKVGATPAATPLRIPSFCDWWIEPTGDTSIDAALREVQAQSIPGIRLRVATDADLLLLKDHKELQLLDLEYTQVTDAGLEHLKNLTGLRALGLTGTQVTEAGCAKLKASLPGCDIIWLRQTVPLQ